MAVLYVGQRKAQQEATHMGKHKRGLARTQTALLPAAVEDYVGADSIVRVIEAYVSQLNLAQLGFTGSVAADTGRPGYAPDDLLSLYLYGYWNRVRSSRRLEIECHRNLEVMWLLGQLTPDHKSIAEFRRLNGVAFRKTCAKFVQLLREASLLGQEPAVVAVDGSHFKASASKASLMSAEQLAKQSDKIEQRIAAYLAQLDQADQQEQHEAQPSTEHIKAALAKLREREQTLANAAVELEKKTAVADKESTPRVGLSDPDCVMLTKGGSSMAGYNVQQAVDTTHKFIIAHEVTTERNDKASLLSISSQAQQALGVENLTSIADSGYPNGEQAQACEALGITPVVRMAQVTHTKGADLYPKSQFTYDAATNTYRCPADQILSRYKRDHAKQTDYYRTPQCLNCAHKSHCTTSGQRSIARSWYAAAAERADARARAQPELMRLRSATAEHPFGNLKAMLEGGFLVRTLNKVKGEMALAVLTYNLKRALNLMGIEGLMKQMRTMALPCGA